MSEKPVLSSGKKVTYGTGATKEALGQGKGRYDLLPAHAIFEVAMIFEKGAIKYAARNWEKGLPMSRLMDSGMRHLFKALEGQGDENHLAQAAWNILCAIETRYRIKLGILPKELDDLPVITP